ncbi:hypothetical protein DVH05_028277 [Phytophthora capsici]|nr:hypothetical protein DVH05_028277 [Phytophthora capsici]
MPIALPTNSNSSSSPPVNSCVLSKARKSATLPVALGSFTAWKLFQHQQPNPSMSGDNGNKGKKAAEMSYEERSCHATESNSKTQSHPTRVTVAWRGAR